MPKALLTVKRFPKKFFIVLSIVKALPIALAYRLPRERVINERARANIIPAMQLSRNFCIAICYQSDINHNFYLYLYPHQFGAVKSQDRDPERSLWRWKFSAKTQLEIIFLSIES